MRVLIADDHTLVRAGIRRLLESQPDIEVVAEAPGERPGLPEGEGPGRDREGPEGAEGDPRPDGQRTLVHQLG